mmetsp:Transcript_37834/g.94829  ORF Transcript_37834/g.94829 Transcript_37834/m.94829 type:complete len:225 (+) Transcript_37834:3055-3729(+)
MPMRALTCAPLTRVGRMQMIRSASCHTSRWRNTTPFIVGVGTDMGGIMAIAGIRCPLRKIRWCILRTRPLPCLETLKMAATTTTRTRTKSFCTRTVTLRSMMAMGKDLPRFSPAGIVQYLLHVASNATQVMTTQITVPALPTAHSAYSLVSGSMFQREAAFASMFQKFSFSSMSNQRCRVETTRSRSGSPHLSTTMGSFPMQGMLSARLPTCISRSRWSCMFRA